MTDYFAPVLSLIDKEKSVAKTQMDMAVYYALRMVEEVILKQLEALEAESLYCCEEHAEECDDSPDADVTFTVGVPSDMSEESRGKIQSIVNSFTEEASLLVQQVLREEAGLA